MEKNTKPQFTKEQLAFIEQMTEQAVLKSVKEQEKKQEQREENSIRLGAKVVSTEKIVGKPVIDKDTKQQKTDNNGIPQHYPDKYKASITFDGGALEIDITEEQFNTFEPNKRYLCVGYYGEVKKFGSSFMEPIFNSITKI